MPKPADVELLQQDALTSLSVAVRNLSDLVAAMSWSTPTVRIQDPRWDAVRESLDDADAALFKWIHKL